MRSVAAPQSFEEFRVVARGLLAEEVPPHHIVWETGAPSLFSVVATVGYSPTGPSLPIFGRIAEHSAIDRAVPGGQLAGRTSSAPVVVSSEQMKLLKLTAMHRDEGRWALMYRLLWRVRTENPSLMADPADSDVIDIERKARQVSRDIHKMHAFIRFRKIECEDGEYYVAWYRPAHPILRAAAPFFVRRFGSRRWSILTPDESAHWDTTKLHFAEGVPADWASRIEDTIEDFWVTYYSAIFNPDRVKVKAMKREMPVRFWETMPETRVIPELLADAANRVAAMAAHAPVRAEVPAGASLKELRAAAKECKACPLSKFGRCTVFGSGKSGAKVMIVGGQPGDEEDKAGRVFVGPAGKILDRVFANIELPREKLYITNAVKHFKWTSRGKHRIHQRPSGSEILACRPWLEAEVSAVKPNVIVCLGATAAQSVLGQRVSIGGQRGKRHTAFGGTQVLVTYHPAAILRSPDTEEQKRMLADISYTLRLARELSGMEPVESAPRPHATGLVSEMVY